MFKIIFVKTQVQIKTTTHSTLIGLQIGICVAPGTHDYSVIVGCHVVSDASTEERRRSVRHSSKTTLEPGND